MVGYNMLRFDTGDVPKSGSLPVDNLPEQGNTARPGVLAHVSLEPAMTRTRATGPICVPRTVR